MSDSPYPDRLIPPTAWQPLPIGGGGYVRHVFPHPRLPEALFASTDVGGVFRSDDGGRTWAPKLRGLEKPMDYCVACVECAADGALFIAAGGYWTLDSHGSIYASTNLGETWTLRNLEPLPALGSGGGPFPGRPLKQLLSADPRDPARLLLVTLRDGLWRSDDAGRTWKRIGPTPNGNVWLSGVWRSPADPDVLCLTSPSLPGESQGCVWLSSDGGSTWRKSCEGRDVQSAAFHPTDLQRLWLSTYRSGVYASEDGGNTWQAASRGLTETEPPNTSPAHSYRNGSCIAADPFEPNRLYLSTKGHNGIFGSHDGGKHWQVLLNPPVRSDGWWCPADLEGGGPRMLATVHLACDPHHQGRLYTCDYKAVYRSDDHGVTWTACYRGLEETFVQNFWFIPKPGGGTTLYLGMNDFGLFHSEDGGKSFSHFHVGRDVPFYWERLSIPTGIAVHGQRLVVAFTRWEIKNGAVVRSDDGGVHWRLADAGLPTARIHGLAADPANPERLLVGLEGYGFYASDDAGQTWVPANEGVSEATLFYGEKGYAHERNGKIYPTHHGDILFHPDRPGLVFASGGEVGLFRSRDAGRSWERIAADVPWDYIQALRWCEFPDGLRLLAAGGDAGLFVADDHGEGWHRLGGFPCHCVDSHPSLRGWIAAGQPGELYCSRDYGQSWSSIPLPETLLRLANVCWDPTAPRLLAGTLGNGAFSLEWGVTTF